MKVAYLFATQRHNVSYVLAKMILPQLEEGRHGVEVVGMFFFEDNNYVLVNGNPIGERLRAVAEQSGMLLMGCDQCCYEREIADQLMPGVPIGCFPDLYAALGGNMPDQVITL
ncbi:SaoD/DsrE family protein [Halomonas sp. NO4]|uniref:SaoD/DsrE family protein n=1 Tax=Halomonas sp. NO4 TaxID=2484813 RepID=UPI0013D34E9F|nr:SaoD/DsrE family protein [Halomonas sp. NO4]